MRFWLSVFAVLSCCLHLYGAEQWIDCPEKHLDGHIQGIAADESGIYWSFSRALIKTDYSGKKLFSMKNIPHYGDVCVVDGKVYVAVIIQGRKNIIAHKKHRAWIFVHDAKTLKFLRKYKIPHPLPDGIAYADGKFYVGGGKGRDFHLLNPLYVYDKNFNLLKEHTLDIGSQTRYGTQTLNIVNGKLLASFYMDKAKKAYFFDLNALSKPDSFFPVRVSNGFAVVPEKIAGEKDVFLIAKSTGKKRDYSAKLRVVKYVDGKLKPFKIPSAVSK